MKTGHGNDIYNQEYKVQVDFSSNVLPNGLSDDLLQFLHQHLGEICHYPDVESTQLKELIAHHHGLNKENVLVTNGANEAFYILAQWKKGARSLILNPAYAEYADACKVHQHQVAYHPHANFIYAPFAKNDLLWLGNPNNPTGNILPTSNLENLLKTYPQLSLVVDEAYAGCTHPFESMVPFLTSHSNLVVVRSLTKQFAIPGLRLGYILANKEKITALSTLQVPWSVNRMAQLAGEWIFSQNIENTTAQFYTNEAQKIQQQLNNIAGIETFPSACNFFLAKLKNHTASELKQGLLQNHGFLIRDAANFEGLTKNHFRIAAQSPDKNQKLVKAISEFCRLHVSNFKKVLP